MDNRSCARLLQVDGKPLGERNPKWLQDDYVKFIRWAQWRIEQTGQGILGFITNHGYLDNPTFRGMRQNLMSAFDEIYLVDLHGNSKKKEVDPATGQPDKNVFDIQQGVAIGIFVKRTPVKTTETKCVVRHAHLYGAKRDVKYKWLDGHTIEDTHWTKLEPESPNYLFIPQDKRLSGEYEAGWKITEAMPLNASTVTTARNDFSMAFDKTTLIERIRALIDGRNSDESLRQRYHLRDVSYWKLADARAELREIKAVEQYVRPYCYRPFDDRFVYYHPAVCERLREEVMAHVRADNISLLTHRPQSPSGEFTYVFCTAKIGDQCVAANKTTGGGNSYQFHLYLYPNGKIPDGDLFVREKPDQEERRPNFSAEFIKELCDRLKVKFVRDGLGKPSNGEIGPELIFNYIYAVFHSPGYRERYAQFLRTDFPRVPLTGDFRLFQRLAGFGGQLVDLHAREGGHSDNVSFPIKGTNVIEKLHYEEPRRSGQDRHEGRVWINKEQYFEGVAPDVWEFLVGGYLPAQLWPKDRVGRTISFGDKSTYARIVFALSETSRLMTEIEKTIHKHGGWPGAFAMAPVK